MPIDDSHPELLDRYLAMLAAVADTSVAPKVLLTYLGTLIDLSQSLGRLEGTQAAITAGTRLLKADITPHERALAHYFLANAQEDTRTLRRAGWDLEAWEQPEIAEQIIHLRTALSLGREGALPPARLTQVLTNLGNLLSHCGRTAEAVDYWDAALTLEPAHGMARGNRGYGLARLSWLSHDPGHRGVLKLAAYADLKRAGEEALEPGARDRFVEAMKRLEASARPGFFDNIDLTYEWPEEMAPEERYYRVWCLAGRLFLNDLNAIGSPIGAADVLVLPTLVTGLNAGPGLLGFYNQMKQEFASARYLLYVGLHAAEPHFSDREVKLVNTLDYPAYGLGLEQVRTAFRMAYSLLDKVAYFLNDYLQLGVSPTQVSFKKIWYARKKPLVLRADVQRPQNSPLKGLFWLSKDLFEDEPGFRDAIEPDAQELEEIRQHLEHKYLKLHSEEWSGAIESSDPLDAAMTDKLGYSLRRDDFEARTLKVLKIARAALLYLAGAVYVEEGIRRSNAATPKAFLPMELPPYEDDWKF